MSENLKPTSTSVFDVINRQLLNTNLTRNSILKYEITQLKFFLRVGLSYSCVGRKKCWPEYKSLRKQCINLMLTPIDRYDQRPPGKIFNFAFQGL